MFRSYYRLSVDWLGSLFHTVPTPEPKLTELTSIFETLMTGGKRTVANFTRSFQTFVQGYTCHLSSHFTDLNNFFKDLFIYFQKEGKGGRKRRKETSMYERIDQLSLACLKKGPGLQPRYVPRLGIEPLTFQFAGQHSIHWATPANTADHSNLHGHAKLQGRWGVRDIKSDQGLEEKISWNTCG